MPRPHNSSSTAWPGSDVTNASVDTPLLAHQDRAVDNVYSDNPSVFRPGSAPVVSSVLARETSRRVIETDALRRANEGNPRARHSRSRRNPLRSQRSHVIPALPDPTEVASLQRSIPIQQSSNTPGSTEIPSRRETCPNVPHFNQFATVGHYSPRRAISEDLSQPINHRSSPPVTPPRLHESRFVFTPTDLSSHPPRPPPTGPRADLRWSCSPDPVWVSPPRMETRQLSQPSEHQDVVSRPAILSQPQSASSRSKSDSISRKSLVVELNKEKSVTTKTLDPKVNAVGSSTKTNFSSKKDTNRDITSQPLDTDHVNINLHSESMAKPGDHNYNCPRCGKCMCPLCKGLPSDTSEDETQCWMCNNRCLCDVDTCVETATCLCCVRGFFYHCTNYENHEYGTDKPCSCRGAGWCYRWSVIGMCSILLPCLLCYPVAQGCVKLCRACASCVRPGCRCKESLR